MIKKLFALLAAICLLLPGCATTEVQDTTAPAPNRTVGISLPDFSWSGYADSLKELLEAEGYTVLVEYAAGDLHLQHAQVQTLVNMPVGCLVVAAMDSMALGDVLTENVPVIALDRMLMYTENVTGCVATDSYAAGQQLGKYIVDAKQLATAEAPLTIEFLMGAPENHSAMLLYQGVMEQLQPYLLSGILQCRSGRTAFEDVALQPATTNGASDRCFDYLADYYTDAVPDILCAASDDMAAGCIGALTSFGVDLGEDWPLITGIGTTETGIENIREGYQNVSLYTDARFLAQQCVRWVLASIQGEPISGNMMFNGVAEIPTALITPTLIDKENCSDILPQS